MLDWNVNSSYQKMEEITQISTQKLLEILKLSTNTKKLKMNPQQKSNYLTKCWRAIITSLINLNLAPTIWIKTKISHQMTKNTFAVANTMIQPHQIMLISDQTKAQTLMDKFLAQASSLNSLVLSTWSKEWMTWISEAILMTIKIGLMMMRLFPVVTLQEQNSNNSLIANQKIHLLTKKNLRNKLQKVMIKA